MYWIDNCFINFHCIVFNLCGSTIFLIRYEGKHGHESGAKGHHDKEGHSGHYGEDGGSKKSHHHDDGYYAEHDAGEKGSKGSSFEEHGSFSKGHSTKGAHSVHKLDEAKKNTEFHDEDHDEGFEEKHGGFEEKSGYAKGGHEAGGHYKKVYLEGEHGKGGKYEKGSHHAEEAGHKGAAGHDSHYAHGENYGKEGGSDGFKKWGYHGHHWRFLKLFLLFVPEYNLLLDAINKYIVLT